MRANKLYGGTLFWPGEVAQSRVIVCAQNRTVAAGLVGVSTSVFNNFFSETGNKIEVEVANGKEGVWIAPLDDEKSVSGYKRVEPQRKEPIKKAVGFRKMVEKAMEDTLPTMATVGISAVAEDILKLRFKSGDTIQSCFDAFYAIMRKHGLKKGTLIRGKLGVSVQGDNFEWTMCRVLFQEKIRSWFEWELSFNINVSLPQDLEY